MSRQHLPARRSSLAFSFEFESHRYRASASFFGDGRIAEIFLDSGKPNTPLQLNAETAAILTSLLLQHGVDAEVIRHSVNGPIAIALDHFSTARLGDGARGAVLEE
jgi:ribonucleoside-diphosphate reductase alpha chain